MSDDKDIERVELDDASSDKLVDRIVERLTPKAEPETDPEIKALRDELAEIKAGMKPQRSELGDEPIKAGDSPIYGGDDAYTSLGSTDAEIASGLYLAKTILGGRGFSERGNQVMLAAADRALKAGPRKMDTTGMYAPTGAAMKYDVAEYFKEARTKAMTSTGANAGDEWVPTLASADLWTDIHLATQVSSQIRRVPMPSNPYTLPTLDDDATFKYASTENTAVTATNLNTGNATLTAVKIQAEVNFSGEVTEDSIIPIVPAIRANLVRRGAQTIDDLNGVPLR